MSTLANAKPASATRPLKALFFGPPGSGKTTLAGTAPKAIMFDTEGGTMSIRGTGVDVLPIPSWSVFESAVLDLMMEKHSYESVILDSGAPNGLATLTNGLPISHRRRST